MKTALKFLAFLALALGASAQQGQMASSFTASSTAPFFTLNRAANTQESSIYFKTAGATTGGWRIYGSNAANQVLHVYSYQAAADVAAFTSTGLAVTGSLSQSSGTGTVFVQNTTRSFATNRNWQLAVDNFAEGHWTLTPSTALGGSTFTTPILDVTSAGLSVTGTLTATGRISTTSDLVVTYPGASVTGIVARDTTNTASTGFIQFQRADSTGIGSITRVGATDAVAYNTTSDARLKANLRDFTDSGPIIDGLRPRLFDWKSGGANAIGFIAQEENEVDPALARIGAVTVGDNDPVCITKQWQRSDAALIPILVAELKSLRARVAALEALNTPAKP